MKKIVLFLLTAFMPIVAFSQNQHMTFMGIPLTGTINAFQSKLVGKGISPDPRANASLPVGVRSFDGDFAGYEAKFYVYYDKNTKVVYRAKACISQTDEGIFEQRYKELKELIQLKYDGYEETGEQNNHESYTVYTELGVVGLYTSVFKDTYPYQNIIHVDYEDGANSAKYKKSQLDDI